MRPFTWSAKLDVALWSKKFAHLWFIVLQKISVHQRILKKLSWFAQKYDLFSKCFLSSKSVYYNDFWKIMWHWRLEKLCWIFNFDHRNKWHFKIYSNRKQLFQIVLIFHDIVFIVFLYKHSLAEPERHLKSSFPKRYKSILIVFMKMTFFYLDPYILLIFNLSC